MTPAQIIAALTGISALIELIQKFIAMGKERGEWTPEQEAEFDARLAAVKKQAHWQPES